MGQSESAVAADHCGIMTSRRRDRSENGKLPMITLRGTALRLYGWICDSTSPTLSWITSVAMLS